MLSSFMSRKGSADTQHSAVTAPPSPAPTHHIPLSAPMYPWTGPSYIESLPVGTLPAKIPCFRCGAKDTSTAVVPPKSNRTKNVGREYRYCMPCVDKLQLPYNFVCFTDPEGFPGIRCLCGHWCISGHLQVGSGRPATIATCPLHSAMNGGCDFKAHRVGSKTWQIQE